MSTGGGLLLLIYMTDWHFIISNTVVALLQYWTIQKKHNFEEIYCYCPITHQEGIAFLIFPTPRGLWKNFDPEEYKDRVTHNLNPQGWH